MNQIRFTEQIRISAMHSLENPDLTEDENRNTFGICYQKHGHDYAIAVVLDATIDPRTGLSVDRDSLREILERKIKNRLHGKFLNPHFESTSGEALSYLWLTELKPEIEKLPGVKLVSVDIAETRKNWFSYSG